MIKTEWDSHIKEFKAYLRLERSLSGHSIEAYLRDVYKLKGYCETFGVTNPILADKSNVENFIYSIAELGLNASTQARILSGVKAFFKFLILQDKMEKDPCELIQGPKTGRKLPDTLSVEEIDRMVESIDLSSPQGHRNKAIIEAMYGCGLRVTELCELKLSSIFFKDGFIKVTGKGNKERLVPIGEVAMKEIELYKNGTRKLVPVQKGFEDFVFLNQRGKNLTRVMIFHIIKDLVKRAGIKKTISPHSLRHSFATHLIEGGADLRVVQEMLGHESITTTEIYTHLDQDYLRSAIMMHHPHA